MEAERTSQYSLRLASDTSCWMAASRWTANYAAGAQRPPGNTPRDAQGEQPGWGARRQQDGICTAFDLAGDEQT